MSVTDTWTNDEAAAHTHATNRHDAYDPADDYQPEDAE